MKRLFFLLPLLLPAYVLRFSIGPIPTTALELTILAITVMWLAMRGVDGLRDAWRRTKSWRIPAGLWLFAGVIAVIVSPAHMQALGLFRAYFIEPLLIFLIGLDLIRTEEDRTQLWRSFCIATIGLAVWAVVQMFTGWGIPHPWDAWPGRRATGPFPFPNALALFVTPIAALAGAKIIEWITARGRLPLQEIGAIIAGLIAILCAQSDGGLVALGAAIFVTLLLHRRTRIIGVGVAMTVVILTLVVAPIRHRVTPVIFLKDWSGMVRTVIWKETATMLTDTSTPSGIARPLLGVGLAAYPTAILPYHSATWMEVFQYPHDIFLNLWSETGVIGLIAFGWIIVIWMRRTKPSERTIAISVLIALLVHGLVDVPYFKNDLAVAFWLLILLTTRYDHETSRN